MFCGDLFNNGPNGAFKIRFRNELEDTFVVSLISDSEAVYCPQISWGLDARFEDEDANLLRRQTVLRREPIRIVCRQAAYEVGEGGSVELRDVFLGGRRRHLCPSGPKR